MYKINEIEINDKQLDDLIKQRESKKPSFYVPEKGEKYHITAYDGHLYCNNYDADFDDKNILANSIVDRTKEEAEISRGRNQARIRVIKYIAAWNDANVGEHTLIQVYFKDYMAGTSENITQPKEFTIKYNEGTLSESFLNDYKLYLGIE